MVLEDILKAKGEDSNILVNCGVRVLRPQKGEAPIAKEFYKPAS